MPKAISGSVGRGGRNFPPSDVMTVQYLLNCVPASQGGPSPELAVDGAVGPKTIGAIEKYQRAIGGTCDGRVDPGGATLRALQVRDPYPMQSITQGAGMAKSGAPGKGGAGDPWGSKSGGGGFGQPGMKGGAGDPWGNKSGGGGFGQPGMKGGAGDPWGNKSGGGFGQPGMKGGAGDPWGNKSGGGGGFGQKGGFGSKGF
ncbi:peptidoglycan-binding domain-containing protein [Thermomonas mangrovi]|uniref:peptidoglycan-binding domain-containing protein n=1 Tax=Thermomonas mangrovi TaxID=2993316 RepID=UPI0023073D35|nr:peptidoglycan-binding domain-containing protein [Thermomonas mangrovi]